MRALREALEQWELRCSDAIDLTGTEWDDLIATVTAVLAAGDPDAMQRRAEQTEQQVRTLHAILSAIHAGLGWPAEESVSAEQVVARMREMERNAEALARALEEAQAILASDELAVMQTMGYVYGARYPEAFLARCRAAGVARRDALARYSQQGPAKEIPPCA